MPKIQTILTTGGTAPTALTLHDASHSFRVARRMAEIIPAEILPRLASYELTLLLLAAYLHDIGMTPEQYKVTLHYQYLLTGQMSDGSKKPTHELTEPQATQFQEWLDDDERGVVPPLVKGKPTVEDLQLANELVTFYCRHRHNDWSEEWMRNHLATETLGSYAGWLDDLVILCRSHHEGKIDLLKDRFNPRPVGSEPHVVHLRYLACVLRIADILEFDPERTPEVILRHREIPPDSLIHWHKDHAITLVLEDNHLNISARPRTARLHRAIESMVDQINDELQLCRELADETHFENCRNLTAKLPHRWDLEHAVRLDLQATEGDYEYINGSFRPNTRKLLELLSGTQLYHDPLAAIRELLQNAFDAVREQMAYQRLTWPSPSDHAVEQHIEKTHRVELRVETRADGAWLVCRDSGVGMTKTIIKDHLLVSGQARRHDILALERRCLQAGFSLGRTGQFGIGVLSYFMVADRVTISTRRSLEPGDSDSTGWRFETEGIGSFGELRRDPNLKTGGSCVELHLRREISEEIAEWYRRLRGNLQDTLKYVPCEFRLNSSVTLSEPINYEPQWTLRDAADFAQLALERLRREQSREELHPTLLTERDRQNREAEGLLFEEIRKQAASMLRWKTRFGELPNGLGRFRLHLPFFELPGGPSLAFLQVAMSGGVLTVGNVGTGRLFCPYRIPRFSWKGMNIGIENSEVFAWFRSGYPERDVGAFVEVDFHSARAGTLSVDRTRLSLTTEGIAALSWLRGLANDLTSDFTKSEVDTPFATLNRRVVAGSRVSISKPRWMAERIVGKEPAAEWREIVFPAVTSLPWAYTESVPKLLQWKGKSVQILRCLSRPSKSDHYEGVGFVDCETPPDRVVAVGNLWRRRIAPIWERNPWKRSQGTTPNDPLICAFPPLWKHICGVRFANYSAVNEDATVWNAHHSLVKKASPQGWKWVTERAATDADPL